MKNKDTQTPLTDEYLETVNGMQEAETNPFFYTRLRAKIEKQDDWRFPLSPSWIVAGLSVLLLLNGFMILNKSKSAEQTQMPATATTAVQSFATEYNLTIQSY